jgi:uncharacterized GH25 family protein
MCSLPTPVPSSSSRARTWAPRGLALLGACAFLAAPVAAHDHWIAPSSFSPAVGERIDVRLCVGHPSQFEEQLRDPRRAVRFEILGPSGTRPLVGLDGRSPAGFFAAREAGCLMLVYQSNHALAEIEPAKYAEYLSLEGLADVQREREQRGETDRPGRDSYLRCDKALLCVGDRSADEHVDGYDAVVGLPIELVLESDPALWQSAAEIVLRLELEGAPLAGRQVKLMHLTAPHTILLARADEHGRARFTPDAAGGWVASCVHQRRARPEQALEGDWESLWASFSFELRAASR